MTTSEQPYNITIKHRQDNPALEVLRRAMRQADRDIDAAQEAIDAADAQRRAAEDWMTKSRKDKAEIADAVAQLGGFVATGRIDGAVTDVAGAS